MAPAKPPTKRGDRPPRATTPGAVSTKIPEGGFPLDAETEAELVKFNVYLAAQQDLEARERRVRKAEQAKQDAAARVRQLADDPKATKEQREEAEQAYKEAVAKLRAIRDGADAAEEDTPIDDSATDESVVDESAVDEAAAGEAATDEAAADATEAPES